jgi:glycosyltransferase involved in cell wall biosynthesis
MQRLKKVLILTYYWPPGGGAGVQRWLKFVKYLRDFGWEPVVYTAENGEMPVIDKSLISDIPEGIEVIKRPIWEPYRIYKWFSGRKKNDKINASFLNENKNPGLAEKISVWIRGNFFIPDARVFWIRPSAKFLKAYIKKNNISHVISSGPPHSMHLIALELKQTFKSLKWVADFRDPWTNIDFYPKLMLSKSADRKHKRLELAVLQNADTVLSIGHHMSDEFKTIYKVARGTDLNKFKVITNGYDDADLLSTVQKKDTAFTLAHVGTLVKDRNPEVLWKVLSKLTKENTGFGSQLQIKLVGKVDVFVKEQLAAHQLTGYVKYIEYLPHNEVIIEQQKSKVLLLLVNNTKNAKGILTGKFFEYLASGTPVLAIGPEDGELATLIHETHCGFISGFEDEIKLEQALLQLFQTPEIKTDPERIKKYSRKALTGQLSEVLNAM